MRRLALVLLAGLTLRAHAAPNPDWTTPITPFRIAGNLYYVGSRDLAAYLITTPQGNILLNSNLESSVPQIHAAIEQLGFKWSDTRILLNSQAHYDHAAGNAEVIRETHARLMVMDGDVHSTEHGDAHEYDSGFGVDPFPPAHVSRALHDGDTVTLGTTTLTAHKTPGHTRGCTAWSMQVKDESGTTRNVVIIGGLAPLDHYRLEATKTQPASYPGIAADFRKGYATQLLLPCDIFLGAHGVYFDLLGKLKRLPIEGEKVWLDPEGYRKAILTAQSNFNTRIAKESTR